MKKLSSLIIAVIITVTTLFPQSTLKANLLNESLESSTVLGDLLHAEQGPTLQVFFTQGTEKYFTINSVWMEYGELKWSWEQASKDELL